MSIWFCGLQILIFNCVGLQIRRNGYKSLYSTVSVWRILVLRITNPYILLRRIANPTQRNPYIQLCRCGGYWFCGLQILIFNCVGLQIRRNGNHCNSCKSDATEYKPLYSTAAIGFADYKSLYSTASDCKSDATDATSCKSAATEQMKAE